MGFEIKYHLSLVSGDPIEPEFVGFVLRLDSGGDRFHTWASRQALNAYAACKKKPVGYYINLTHDSSRRKYNVSKVDGSPVDPKARYFVLRLDLTSDSLEYLAARKAIMAYTKACTDWRPELAQDLNLRFAITAETEQLLGALHAMQSLQAAADTLLVSYRTRSALLLEIITVLNTDAVRTWLKTELHTLDKFVTEWTDRFKTM